jgi:hypothetical protein
MGKDQNGKAGPGLRPCRLFRYRPLLTFELFLSLAGAEYGIPPLFWLSFLGENPKRFWARRGEPLAPLALGPLLLSFYSNRP